MLIVKGNEHTEEFRQPDEASIKDSIITELKLYVIIPGESFNVAHWDWERADTTDRIIKLVEPYYIEKGRQEVIKEIARELVDSDSRNMWYLNKRFWQAIKGNDV